MKWPVVLKEVEGEKRVKIENSRGRRLFIL
jgi:hypothetical protein